MEQQQRRFVTFMGISPIDVGAAVLTALLYFFQPSLVFLVVDGPTTIPSSLGHCAFIVIGLLYSVPMAVRRTHPVAANTIILGAAAVRYFFDSSGLIPADFAVLAAIYAITIYGPSWAYRSALVFTLSCCVLDNLPMLVEGGRLHTDVASWFSFINIVTLTGICVIFAYNFALTRRTQLEQLEAMRIVADAAEHRLQTEANLAVLEERSRIAREMHDIVAHTLSVIIAQADGGRYAATKNPEAGGHALTTISEMARDALKDIRSIIGVLRDTDGDDQPTLPQPIDRDVESLIDSVRESGVAVSLVRLGAPRTLPVGVGNAIYRICQEAITNSLKHAGPSPEITVLLRTSDTSLVLQVDDDGRGAASISDGKGHGLIGMSERAAAFNGSVATGPRPGGGFRVLVTIPLPPVDNSRSAHDYDPRRTG